MAPVGDTDSILVVGAGISGLAAAILLARDHGCSVVVYERATELSENMEDSHLLGLNPRGIRVLDMINPHLTSGLYRAFKPEIDMTGVVEGWSINHSGKEVAKLPSGVVVGTTRSSVIAALYQEAVGLEGIQFRMGHKLREFDAAAHILRFECGGIEVKVDASKARILDCTGCWSKIRSGMEKADQEFNVETYAWGTVFRNLFTNDAPEKCPLDPKWHYIFAATKMSGIYGAVMMGKKWVFSIGCDPDSPWLLENEAKPEYIEQLKALVAEKCPPAALMLDEKEYERFFSRKTFAGQVVKVSKLNQGEHILLLGDAAHAVTPMIPEGTNAALEDVSVLVECLVSSRQSQGFARGYERLEDVSGPIHEKGWFESYNAQRLPDARALSDYARYCASCAHVGQVEQNKRMANMIAIAIVRKMKIYGPTWNELTFGPASTLCKPYREAFASWQSQSSKIRGLSNFVAWFANRKLPQESPPLARVLQLPLTSEEEHER